MSKLVRILLPVSNQGTTEACRDAAFHLATDFGAELEVLHLCAAAWQRLPYSTELSPFYSQELIDIGRDQIVQEQAQAKAWFEQASRVHSCSTARFQTIEGFLTPVVTGRARVADLSVVPSIGEKDDEFWAGIRDAVLFQSGRPALIVPDGASSAFGETVVVAWKDGVEAVRAVAAAAPFFAKAASVSLLSVAESNEGRHLACGDGRISHPVGSQGRRVEGRSTRRRRRQDAARRGLRQARRVARHGRLWPLAVAGMGLWRRHPRGAARHHLAGADGTLTRER